MLPSLTSFEKALIAAESYVLEMQRVGGITPHLLDDQVIFSSDTVEHYFQTVGYTTETQSALRSALERLELKYLPHLRWPQRLRNVDKCLTRAYHFLDQTLEHTSLNTPQEIAMRDSIRALQREATRPFLKTSPEIVLFGTAFLQRRTLPHPSVGRATLESLAEFPSVKARLRIV